MNYTSDGIPVLLHDDTIDRTSNGTGKIQELTYEQVRQYDFGEWFPIKKFAGTKIPTFEEFVITCKKLGLKMQIEPKTVDESFLHKLIDITMKHNMQDNAVWNSVSYTGMQRVAAYYDKATLLYTNNNTSELVNLGVGLKNGKNKVCVSCDKSLITAALTQQAHENGLDIWTWETSDTATILDLVEKGIDVIASNMVNASKVVLDNLYATV